VGDDGQKSYPEILATFLQEYRSTVQVVNEGQNGWQVDDVADHITQWLQPVSPNIILLQIGTNDLEQGSSPQATADRLSLLVTQIQMLAPKAHLYVASCTPVNKDNAPRLPLTVLQDFNDLIPKIVKDHERLGHFIVFVDLYKRADLDTDDLGPDGEHPNDNGYEKIAEYWSWELQRREMSSLRQFDEEKGIVSNEQ